MAGCWAMARSSSSVLHSRPKLVDGAGRASTVATVTRARGSSFLRSLLVGLDAAALTVSWISAVVLVPTSTRSMLGPSSR